MKPSNPMRGVVWRDGGWWFNKTTKGVRDWINLETKDAAEAVRKALEIRNHPLLASSDSLAGAIVRFLYFKRHRGHFTANSKDKARYILGDFVAFVGPHATLRTINHGICARWYDGLRKRVTESTAQSYMLALRSLFRWAVEVERVRVDNPVAKVSLARFATPARERFCTRQEKDTLLAAAPHDDLRFILFCGFDAGLRRNEISEARCGWFDLQHAILHVRKTTTFMPKDKEERAIDLTRPFKTFLDDYLKGRALDDFALQPAVVHGLSRYRYDFRRPFTDFMRAQKMEWVTPHVMRHSFASILASAGVSIFKIACWLGDDVRVVQKHYARLVPGDKDIHRLTS